MPQIIGGNAAPDRHRLEAARRGAARRADARRAGHRDVYADNWYALFAPAKTPAPVIAKLNAAFTAALNDPEVGRKLVEAGADPAPATPEAARRDFLKSDLDRWGKIIRDKNIKQGS